MASQLKDVCVLIVRVFGTTRLKWRGKKDWMGRGFGWEGVMRRSYFQQQTSLDFHFTSRMSFDTRQSALTTGYPRYDVLLYNAVVQGIYIALLVRRGDRSDKPGSDSRRRMPVL